MTDPAEFLKAVLGTVEATATAASTTNGSEWTFVRGPIDNALITGDLDGPFGCVVAFDEGAPSEPQAAHIAANDPAHVLRMVAAHRAILDLYIAAQRWTPLHGDFHVHQAEVWAFRKSVELLAEAYGWTPA